MGLDELVARDPAGVLGPAAAEKFNKRLPFLFKVLAAGTPLSIQAHPNLHQAASGYRRENDAGVPLDAFNRNYKDDNHKPEIICALTEYEAMRGFRSAAQIADNFSRILIDELRPPVERLQKAADPEGALSDRGDAEGGVFRDFFTRLMTLEDGPKAELIAEALKVCTGGDEGLWIQRLSELYPGDIGIVSPLYLNLVTLKPGEAMYLPAGELHAYLRGLGIELMANSDNVLRGGLTSYPGLSGATKPRQMNLSFQRLICGKKSFSLFPAAGGRECPLFFSALRVKRS
jgi:mannose-6-phosphate isomerase